MPLNISGSIVNASIADTLDTEGIVKRGLALYLDADSLDSYPGKDTVYDISTNTNNGTMYNGSALTFDGSDDWISMTQVTHPYNCTLMVWIKTSTASKSICSHSSGGPVSTNYNINASGYLEFAYYDGTWRTIDSNPVTVTDGNWHHVVWARNGTNHKMYKDGKLIDEGTLNSQMAGAIDAIGRNWSGYNFNGLMSDFRIYSTQLSATDISEIYNNPTTVLPGSITSSQIFQWATLTEGYGTITYDGSGNNRIGTLTNGPTWTGGQTTIPQLAGKVHSQKMFHGGSGTGDYVNAGAAAFSFDTGDFTMACWFNTTSATNEKPLIAKGYYTAAHAGNFQFRANEWNQKRIRFSGGNGQSSAIDIYTDASQFSDNVWNHAVVTRKSGAWKMYLNGTELSITNGTPTYTGNIGNNAANASIGAEVYYQVSSTNGYFPGLIDEVGSWNKSLDAAAVTAIYNSGVPIDLRNNSSNYDEYTDNLVGYWRNDGVGIWKDLSGQENDGTETGSPVQVFFPKGTTSERDSQGFPTGPGSFQFKGDNDYINLGNSSGNFSTTVPTISCWIRTASTTSQTIINDEAANGYCGLFLVYMDASGTILWRRGNSSNTEWGFVSTNTINDGNWHNVVCIDNGSALSVYIDGVSETAASTPGTYESPAVASGRNVAIGVLARDYTSANFDGNIGSIYLYNRILTQAEVSHNFNVQRDRFGV